MEKKRWGGLGGLDSANSGRENETFWIRLDKIREISWFSERLLLVSQDGLRCVEFVTGLLIGRNGDAWQRRRAYSRRMKLTGLGGNVTLDAQNIQISSAVTVTCADGWRAERRSVQQAT
jgi:hypothetical protein